MYGLESDVDLKFLLGRRVEQIAVGEFQFVLNLDGGITWSIESTLTLESSGVSSSVSADSHSSCAPLLQLVGEVITHVAHQGRGDVKITFSNSISVTVHDSNESAESYQLSGGPDEIVV
ncbi:MAG: DUF6188 family protein [Myxococcota bacterium]